MEKVCSSKRDTAFTSSPHIDPISSTREYSKLTQLPGCMLPKEWQTFCDFQEIMDISVKRVCEDQGPPEQGPQDASVVTVTRSDDRPLVSQKGANPHSLNFV